MRIRGLGFLAAAWAAAALAQTGPAPVAIENGREISGSAGTAGPGGFVGCYAVTAPGSGRLVVELIPAGFEGELRIVPGESCDSAVPPSRRTWQGDAPVALSIPVAPGRYAVSVRRTVGAGGSFRLVARHTPSSPGGTAGFAPAPASNSTGQVTASGFAPPSGNAQSVERQMMLDRLERGEVQTVGAEALRRRAELDAATAEQRARQEQMAVAAAAPQVDIAGSFMQGFNQGIERANEAARADAAHNRRIQAMAAEYEAQRARERARVAETQARNAQQQRLAQQQAMAAQQRMQEARGQQQAAAAQQRPAESSATPDRPTQDRPEVEMIAMLEGVVVCPLNPDRAGLYGASACHGPFTSVAARPDQASGMNSACGNNSNAARDLGTYGNHRVWGCGYGINPRRSGSPNIDQAARFGLVIPSRQTFRCRADIDGYCRN